MNKVIFQLVLQLTAFTYGKKKKTPQKTQPQKIVLGDIRFFLRHFILLKNHTTSRIAGDMA